MLCRSAVAVAAISLAANALTVLPAPAQQSAGRQLPRGEYLAIIMDCGGCHTTGALAGQPDPKMNLAGSNIGFGIPNVGAFWPPNLTSDRETGLGSWSEADIVRAIRTGARPDGRMLAPMMPWQSYAALTDEDAQALARYLKDLPPVRHAVPPPVGPDMAATAPYLAVVTPKR